MPLVYMKNMKCLNSDTRWRCQNSYLHGDFVTLLFPPGHKCWPGQIGPEIQPWYVIEDRPTCCGVNVGDISLCACGF